MPILRATRATNIWLQLTSCIGPVCNKHILGNKPASHIITPHLQSLPKPNPNNSLEFDVRTANSILTRQRW